MSRARLRPAQLRLPDPTPWNRAEAQDPVVEAAQGPAVALDEPGVEALHLEPAKEVAHWDSRGGGVPIHVATRASGREADSILQTLAGGLVGKRAVVEADIDDDAVRAPERIVELDEPR